MIKVIFFDIDGTLLSHTSPIPVSEATFQAFDLLKEKDIKRIACTGRHIMELDRLPLGRLEFDGYIILNGQAYYDENRKLIRENYMNERDTRELVDFYNMKLYPTMLSTPTTIKLNYINDTVIEVQKQISSPVEQVGEYEGEHLLNGVIFASPDQEEEVRKYLPHSRLERWNDKGADIMYNQSGKAEGVMQYLSEHHLTREESMGFGDSFNDRTMLKTVGLSVAMGNAPDELKAIADYVTDHIDDDGVYKALKHFAII